MEGSTEAKVGICRGEPSSKTLRTVPGTQKVPGELEGRPSATRLAAMTTWMGHSTHGPISSSSWSLKTNQRDTAPTRGRRPQLPTWQGLCLT